MDQPGRPITVLIAAMGGEGGGVLTAWLVEAATAAGLVVQSTSIPGVAQRTGATTYYVEIVPEPVAAGAPQPVLALYPTPGQVDLMVASELLEAGRAIRNGYVTPDRTTLVAATHRIYSIAEKSAMGDGRLDDGRIREAAGTMARQAVMADFAAAARESGSALNAVLLGAMAGSGRLPIPEDAFAGAIRAAGKAVDANLAGFARGAAVARGEWAGQQAEEMPAGPHPVPIFEDNLTALLEAVRDVAREALPRLVAYQDRAYAKLYLDRVESLRAVDTATAAETARHLALWMCYEDVIRVADLKIHPDRAARIRREVRAKDHEPVHVSEFLKPGLEEVAAILPPALARPLLGWAEKNGRLDRWRFGMEVRTDRVSGFLKLWLLARLKPLRRKSHRYALEQSAIEVWLDAVRQGAAVDRRLAEEIVACARLLKGYGETHRRGHDNFGRIQDALIAPAIAGIIPPAEAADRIAGARNAALADPSADALARELEKAPPPALAAQ